MVRAISAGKRLSASSVDEYQRMKERCRSLLEDNQRLEEQEARLAEAGRIIEELSALIRRDLRISLTEDGTADADECWPTADMPRARSSSSLQVSLIKAASVRRAMQFASGPTPAKGPAVKRTALGPKSPNLR